ncbi:hypothetical protein AB6N16_20830 [Pseudomonas marginalis]
MLINETLNGFRFRSFFMNGNLVCEFLVFFLNLSSSGWVSLTISEGVSSFVPLSSEPELVGLSEINDDFAYPIKELSSLKKFLGLKVLAVYEYRLSGVDDGCVGVYLEFDGCGLSVLESDDCLSVVEGVVDYSNNCVSLCEISF